MRKFMKLITVVLVCTMSFSTIAYAGDASVSGNAGITEETQMQDSFMAAGLDGEIIFADINGYNKMVKYENDDMVVTYGYDEFGRRKCKNVNGTVFYYEYEDERLVKETYDGNEIEYIYEYDSCIPRGFIYSGNLYIYKKDTAGNIVGISTEDNSVSAEYIFTDNWILQDVVTDNRNKESDIYNAAIKNHFCGIGYYYDTELGIYYNGRYYSTSTGSFLGNVCDTEDVCERVVRARGSVDYDMEADNWAQDLLNSSSYGRALGDYSENWFSQLSTVEILARLIYGENNGSNRTAEREAIAWLLVYRLSNPEVFGTSLREVATMYGQFSTIYPVNEDTTQEEKNVSTHNAMNPSSDMAWRSATYLACLICLTQNNDNIYDAIGKPAYYSNQVFIFSYKSVYDNSRLIGSGGNLVMKAWADKQLAVKDVAIVDIGTYANSAYIYSNYVYTQAYGTRNVFYNLR